MKQVAIVHPAHAAGLTMTENPPSGVPEESRPPVRQRPVSLLVSVRNAAEALAALEGGAGIIDVKEPSHGALGRAAADQIAAIHQVFQHRDPPVPFSVALGELRELASLESLSSLLPDITWLKVGLSHCRHTGWCDEWSRLQHRIQSQSPSTRLIAVAYADAAACAAPEPAEVVSFALQSGAPGVLFDTYTKSGRSLFDEISATTLRAFIAELHGNGRFAALAGSLRPADFARGLDLYPDILAVRSAACVGGRSGTVHADKVRELHSAIQDRAMESSRPSHCRTH